MIRAIFLALSIFVSVNANAATWSLYAGAGEAFEFPATVRLGYDDLEFGLMTSETIGAVKSFRDGNWYATFGPTIHMGSNGFGFMAGVGWQPALFWGLRFRSEVAAWSVHTGITKAQALVGLSYVF